MRDVGIFPRLREGAIVPEVAFVREAVAYESKLAFLGVLLDGVEDFFFGDLCSTRWSV
jgi:hypothetical protein